MANLKTLFLTTAATLAASSAALGCELRFAAAPAQRVELYTSEGCSSCPPADRWLSELPARSDRIVLAFQVDYWDDLGWPDRFADARFGERQRDIAARSRSRTVYTPAVVVEGAEFRGWRSGLPNLATADAPVLAARLSLGAEATVELHPTSAFPASATAHLAITEDGLSSEVRAGENRGQRLRHDHVVRAYAGPQGLDQPLRVDVPADLDRHQSRLVVWIEDADGRTLQSLSQPLDACAADSPNMP